MVVVVFAAVMVVVAVLGAPVVLGWASRVRVPPFLPVGGAAMSQSWLVAASQAASLGVVMVVVVVPPAAGAAQVVFEAATGLAAFWMTATVLETPFDVNVSVAVRRAPVFAAAVAVRQAPEPNALVGVTVSQDAEDLMVHVLPLSVSADICALPPPAGGSHHFRDGAT
jgi:hypothetical protein